MIMYYPERFKATEAGRVLMRMRESYEAVFSAREDAHFKILSFARDIQSKFDLDNLHLTDRHGHDLTDRVVSCVKQLGESVGPGQHACADGRHRCAAGSYRG